MVRKFANFLNADYPRAIFIEKVSQYAKAFWLKQRLFGVFVTNCCVCCKFATKCWGLLASKPLWDRVTMVYGRLLNLQVFFHRKQLAVLAYGIAICHAGNVVGHRPRFIHFGVGLKFIGQ